MARIPPKTIPLTLQWMYNIHDSHTHKETCPFLHNIQIFPRQTMNEPQVLQMWSKRGPGRGHQKNLVISWRERRERETFIGLQGLCYAWERVLSIKSWRKLSRCFFHDFSASFQLLRPRFDSFPISTFSRKSLLSHHLITILSLKCYMFFKVRERECVEHYCFFLFFLFKE